MYPQIEIMRVNAMRPTGQILKTQKQGSYEGDKMLAATIEKEKMTDQTSAGGLVTYLSQKTRFIM